MKDCTICKRQNNKSTIVYEDDEWIVRHSTETNIPGYLVIEPRRHFLDIGEAAEWELESYGEVLANAMRAIRDVVEADRIYTFSLGESCPHYHLHVIPRRPDFPRAYRARGIMQYPLEPEIDGSVLDFMCERLRHSFQRLATSACR